MPIMFPGTSSQRRAARSDKSNMVNDAISDLLTRVKNGYMAHNSEVGVPWSKLGETVIKVLSDNGYIDSYKMKENGGRKEMTVSLKYEGKQPAISDVRRVSRPSLRVYVGKSKLPRVLGGLGMAIISTPMGIMTDKEARQKRVGGEVLAEVW